jgi:hypothetical protein
VRQGLTAVAALVQFHRLVEMVQETDKSPTGFRIFRPSIMGKRTSPEAAP